LPRLAFDSAHRDARQDDAGDGADTEQSKSKKADDAEYQREDGESFFLTFLLVPLVVIRIVDACW